MDYTDYLEKFKKIFLEYQSFDTVKIPLCAAETFVSSFSKQALNSIYEGKYITGNNSYDENKDFIGSQFLKKILDFSNEIGRVLFHTKYTDFRCLTGMNTVAIVLMSLIDKDKKVLITDPSSGGHGSLPKLCDNFGIKYDSMPYNMDKMQIDYDKLNCMLEMDNSIGYVFFCQSDIICIPDLEKIKFPKNVTIVYDATQTLGLIASRTIPNPVDFNNNLLLIGGTHKTFPGTTCGFIATNNDILIEKMDMQISPNFLRNTQINNIASVCLTMIELLKFGKDYSCAIVKAANDLGSLLEKKGISVKKIDEFKYTETHQIFISVEPKQVDLLYSKFKENYITLNKRNTDYIRGFRLGLQEVARYELVNHLEELSTLISGIINNTLSKNEIKKLVTYLSEFKKDNYYINDIFMG